MGHVVPDRPGGLVSSSFPVAFQHLCAPLCWGLLLSAWCDRPIPQPPTAPVLCRPPCAAQGDGQGQEGRARRRIQGGAGHVNAEEAQGGGPRPSSAPALGVGPPGPGVTQDRFPVLSPGLKCAGPVLVFQ